MAALEPEPKVGEKVEPEPKKIILVPQPSFLLILSSLTNTDSGGGGGVRNILITNCQPLKLQKITSLFDMKDFPTFYSY